MQQQQQHLPHSTDARDYQEQLLTRLRQQQQLAQRSQAPRIIKYPDPHGQHRDAHGHSRSSSTSSLDIDEMLLRATTGDEHGGGGTPNGTGAPYIDSPHHHHLTINQRRRSEREDDSPRPHSANNSIVHPGHITTTTNPYPPQHPSNVTYPANQSAPAMSSLRAPAQSSQNQVIQTHIFAPVVTGAPTKKTKFPNTIQAGPGSGVGLPGMSFYFLVVLFFFLLYYSDWLRFFFSQLISTLTILFHSGTSDFEILFRSPRFPFLNRKK